MSVYITTIFSKEPARREGEKLIFDDAVYYVDIDPKNYLEVVDYILSYFLEKEPNKASVIAFLLKTVSGEIIKEYGIEKSKIEEIIYKSLEKIKSKLDQYKTSPK